MAAGLGFKTFTTGEVLTAADTNGYLMQGVLVFASAAARDAAITSPQEGQFAYLKDTNVTTYHTGSAWTNLDTTGMTNPMTTTGDMVYSSSGSTPARLGIGTTGQVITVAGGIPSWATPATSGFVGCSLTKSSSQSIATNTETKVTFQTEKFDTDGFHTGSDARITIPSGKAGKYLVMGQVMSNSSGYVTQGGLKVNNTTDLAVTYISGATPVTAPCMVVNNIYNLAVADYIELFVYQGSGVNKDVLSDAYSPFSSYFSVQYLGA
jgi:hypothetical protein